MLSYHARNLRCILVVAPGPAVCHAVECAGRVKTATPLWLLFGTPAVQGVKSGGVTSFCAAREISGQLLIAGGPIKRCPEPRASRKSPSSQEPERLDQLPTDQVETRFVRL